jgi:hypothetical protein
MAEIGLWLGATLALCALVLAIIKYGETVPRDGQGAIAVPRRF